LIFIWRTSSTWCKLFLHKCTGNLCRSHVTSSFLY